jgi:folate-binding protein YgfZ
MTSIPFPGTSAANADAPAPAERPVVLDYGDPAAEYTALRGGALLVDRSHHDRWTFRGAKAAETLTGLVTNDVVALQPGHGLYAAALTPKGKIVADVRLLALADPAAPALTEAGGGLLAGAALFVDVPQRAAAGWEALVRKFVNPRVAPYRREGAALRAFGVYGVRARDAVAAAFGVPPSALAQLPPYGHARVASGGDALLLLRVPDLGLDGFEIVVGADAFDAAWGRVLAADAGVVAGGQRAYDVARIEAGRPEWGVDIDDTTLPQEANLDELHAISYTKGCYTGQEVVARIHFRGHVNRHLRGIAYPALDAGGVGGAGPLPHGARLLDEGGKVVGDVRSAAVSPRLGGVALAMVRREIELGTPLTAEWVGGGAADGAVRRQAVTVGTLPFPL